MNESMLDAIDREFVSPGAIYRGTPFWSWNGQLEPETIREQVGEMQKMGLGGFFMHARTGLSTPYLGEQWFSCIETATDEARKHGMYAYLYDEDRWPSGTAGGMVTENPEFGAQAITVQIVADPASFQLPETLIALYAARMEECSMYGLRKLDPMNPALKTGESLLCFFTRQVPGWEWFQNNSYLDVLNPEAVKSFIEITYEAYFRKFGKRFGKDIPAIFTDEPQYVCGMHPVGKNGWMSAWTAKLPEFFSKKFGYDLCEHLPALFFHPDGIIYSQVRLHYIECLTELFINSYIKQISDWCSEHGIDFTGHLMFEDALSSQSCWVGDAMRAYEYMHRPGMDQLTEYYQHFDTVKQLSSVARQFDRRWRLSELYGCTGWDFPFSGHKALGDWQCALGVNWRCQHLAWYTMAGDAKRDYPAAISWQSPWYREYWAIEDYFARINLVQSHGREQRELLVIHPLESMWMLIAADVMSSRAVHETDNALRKLRNHLLKNNIDFDYGSEDILARHGAVIHDCTTVRLRVGAAEYRAVLLPEMLTIRRSTLELICDFLAAGGEVSAIALPRFVDGREPDASEAAMIARIDTTFSAQKRVEDAARRIRLSDSTGESAQNVLYQLREDNGCLTLFLVNTGFPDPLEASDLRCTRVVERTRIYPQLTLEVFTEYEGEWIELDLRNGNFNRVAAERTAFGWSFPLSLGRLESRMFLLAPAGRFITKRTPQLLQSDYRIPQASCWKFTRTEPNVLILDHPAWRLNQGEWEKPTYFMQINRKIREDAGFPQSVRQPWARKPSGKSAGSLELRYYFTCEEFPDALFLVLEQPERYRITCNGKPLNSDADGWWVDPALQRLPIAKEVLNNGKNELHFTVDYLFDEPGIETVFLIGEFGVIREEPDGGILTGLPEITPGDWTLQKLPYYSGSGIYSLHWENAIAPDERVFIRCGEFGGAAVKIMVNDILAGIAFTGDEEIELTPYFDGIGTATLTLEVLGTRRNSHGPFYMKRYPMAIGPAEFEQYDHSDRKLVPAGLLELPEIILRHNRSQGDIGKKI